MAKSKDEERVGSFDMPHVRLAARTLRVIKRGGFSDIDDWEAPPASALMGQIKRVHNLGKTSSWTEIGPVGNRDPGGSDPMRYVQFKEAMLKQAEPPPPEGVSAEEWDKILSSRKRTAVIRDKLAYKLQGHTNFQGLPISIENRRGSVRKGKDGDGNEWRTKMKHPYGYITGTRGADGEPVDAYVGPDKQAPAAFVVHQRDKETGSYDEDKIMLGFRTKKDAKEAFLAHYDSPKFLGPISTVPIDRLRELVASKRKLVKISHVKEAKLDPEERALREAQKKSYSRERLKGGLVGASLGAALGTVPGILLRSPQATGVGVGIGTMFGGSMGEHFGSKRGRAKSQALRREFKQRQMEKESSVRPEEETERRRKLVRKAGPGIGGLVGAGIGALLGARKGKILKGAIAGLGTGATIGWVPGMAHSAKEAIKEYRSHK